jgi:hypothetical protein
MSKTPQEIAIMIAVLIDRDPVMAGQIKDHIPAARLAELLGLNAPAEAPVGQLVMQDPNPLGELAPEAPKA